ncbi:MAG: DUF4349 domain-containing protein [Spirochaetaceae bacterium]
MRFKIIKWIIFSSVFLFINACSSNSEASSSYAKSAMYEEDMEPEMEVSDSMDEYAENDIVGSKGSEVSERKRIYNGETRLVVESIEDSKKEIEELTISVGGYITQIYDNSISIKIPAAQFHEIFENILLMGDVESKNITTYDVTDYYNDSTAQLETANKTRERLQLLLLKSTKPEERAKILKEIGRLTEEIELIKNRLLTLDNNISFSTIVVELIPRLEQNIIGLDIPFSWIEDLHPLYSVSNRIKAKLDFNPGTEYAVFSKDKIYRAESSLGTTITVSTVKNQPLGDNKFWHRALLHFISNYYSSAKSIESSIGDQKMLGIEFLSKDKEPFKYFVGIVVIKKEIHVIEIFSPKANTSFSLLYIKFEEGKIR